MYRADRIVRGFCDVLFGGAGTTGLLDSTSDCTGWVAAGVEEGPFFGAMFVRCCSMRSVGTAATVGRRKSGAGMAELPKTQRCSSKQKMARDVPARDEPPHKTFLATKEHSK